MNIHTPARRSGFTLVELILVTAIMGVVMAVGGVAIPSSLASQRLSGGARQLSADLDHAASLARRDNKPVEVRFYKLKESDGIGGVQYRAYKIGKIVGWDESGTAKVEFKTEMQQLPTGVIITPDTVHTTLVAQGETLAGPADTAVDASTPYIAYQIRPDGGTNLPRGKGVKASITLINEPRKGVSSTLPADYRTIVIDPINGDVKLY